jgi:hypothetical protein
LSKLATKSVEKVTVPTGIAIISWVNIYNKGEINKWEKPM